MAKKKDHGNLSKEKIQNLVAKHSRNMAGAGAHVPKKGEKAPRIRQKRQWKKDMHEGSMIEQMNEAARDADPFETAIREVEREYDINLSEMKYGEGTCGGHENEEASRFTSQQKADMNKLIQQYQGHGGGNVHSALGDDLEMLEYQPEEIPPMIEYITSQLVSNS